MRIASIGVLLGTAVATLLGVGQVTIAQASSAATVSVSQSESTTRWFVQLSGKPRSAGGSAATLASEKQAFRAAAKATGISFKERFAYDTLWNGFSIDVRNPAQAALLRSVPGVKAVYPVVNIEAPPKADTDGVSSLDMASAVMQTGVNNARSSSD